MVVKKRGRRLHTGGPRNFCKRSFWLDRADGAVFLECESSPKCRYDLVSVSRGKTMVGGLALFRLTLTLKIDRGIKA